MKEADILKLLPTHKEMRKGRGVVKMSPGEIDSREVQIDESWSQDDQSESERDIDEEKMDEDAIDAEAIDDDPPLDSGSGSNEEEDEVEVEEEIHAPAPSSKRKRPGASFAHPNKRVSFAAGTATKESKSSRIKMSEPKSSPKGLPKRHGKAKKV